MKQALQLILLSALVLMAWQTSAAENTPSPDSKQAMLLVLDGSVNPGTAHYLVSNLQSAQEENYDLVIIQMNTPGGLDLAMRDIIREILASKIPVATYVYPPGSRAASAGTYILYASHVSAMAPATNLGAATPVSIGGMPKPAEEKGKEGKEESASEDKPQPKPDNKSAMEKKIINDAEAYLRSLAAYHDRNIDWVKNAVREGESLSSQEALEIGVIDLVADNPQQLLLQIDQRQVRLPSGQETLDTSGMTITTVEPDWKMELLSIISDPNIAYILLLIGIYGLIFEGYNPGALIPGVIGAICLLLAMYALQILPVNYVAAALLVLGIALLVVEAFAPSFGILGVGGIIAFLFGSFLLFDEPETGVAVALPILITVTIVSVVLLSFILSLALKARDRPVVSGREELLYATGIVIQDFENEGWVRVHGEMWKGHCQIPLQVGQAIKVVAIDDLELTVEPISEAPNLKQT